MRSVGCARAKICPDSLSPAMAVPRVSITGDLRLDSSRLTDNCAFRYILPNQPQMNAVTRAGTMNVGAKMTTMVSLARRVSVR